VLSRNVRRALHILLHTCRIWRRNRISLRDAFYAARYPKRVAVVAVIHFETTS